VDILLTLFIAVPLTAFATIFFISAVRVNRENEIYTEGYIDGQKAAWKEGAK
jgi:hypothetical protein